MAAPKKYGLILPKTKQGPGVQKAAPSNVFGDDSDDEHSKTNIEEMIKKESIRNLKRLETQTTMQKALDQDAKVFEYDEIYDDMKAEKEAQDISNKVITKDRKPKYIDDLLKNAAIRKKEDERRQQRKIQKEREEEKNELGDKEAFVTSAYKKKMEEMKREEEETKRREQLEDMMDVTKQKDLTGFYRHLLKQQCGEEKVPGQRSVTVPEEPEKPEAAVEAVPSSSKHFSKDPDADTDIEMSSDEEEAVKAKRKPVTRTYRKRKQESDSEDEPTNQDADESIEESSSESEDEDEAKTTKKKEDKSGSGDQINDESEDKPEAQQRKPKDWRELMTKRSVREKFESARERFLLRQRGVAAQ
ncbi:nuclear speckle splicing regulatory protein 1 [Galendromus occidentalis]|uniref:Nuclear speckle splicing regulatory protein 1 n=1 Tax=Galendromus occidentalis TaxID=34638 RepID=A0AAJ6W0R3_9ACAR|nr:nuclear speckle splicing regulatory protein 1 [Galendromus occidentalis]